MRSIAVYFYCVRFLYVLTQVVCVYVNRGCTTCIMHLWHQSSGHRYLLGIGHSRLQHPLSTPQNKLWCHRHCLEHGTSRRMQYVRCGATICGVPHGSVLGPVLFTCRWSCCSNFAACIFLRTSMLTTPRFYGSCSPTDVHAFFLESFSVWMTSLARDYIVRVLYKYSY